MVKNARIQLGAPFSESFSDIRLPLEILRPVLAPILTSKHGSILPGTALAPILTSLELFSGDSGLLTAYF